MFPVFRKQTSTFNNIPRYEIITHIWDGCGCYRLYTNIYLYGSMLSKILYNASIPHINLINSFI